LRDFFLNSNSYLSSKSVICREFGQIIRKLWSNENFKSVISPVEFMQGISTLSKKRFDIGKSSECVDFLIWLLGELHRGLGGSNKKKTVVHDSFQGEIEIKTRTFNSKSSYLKADKNDMSVSEENDESFVETITKTNFNFLSLDIPPTPLFRDSSGGMIIPQIPLFEVLKKFDGHTWTDHIDATGKLTRKQFSIKKFPKYLILHLVRFTKNNFNAEKNVTIVTFPVKNLELRDYLFQNNETLINIENVEEKSISDLKEIVRKYGSPSNVSKLPSIIDKSELIDLATIVVSDSNSQQLLSSKYDLLSNICHDSVVAGAGSGSKSGGKATKNVSQGGSGGTNSNTGARSSSTEGYYRTHLQNKSTGQWFELQDLHVSETMPQLIGLSESYMLIYERKDIK
jgi:U4/U6.U5 tri-snRNP-associated protein 2